MRLPTAPLSLSDSHREVLEALAKSGVTAHRDVQRARVLLLAGDGQPNTYIGATVGVSPSTVKAWRERFSQDGLKEFGAVRPGRGRKPSNPAEKVEAIVHATLHEKPAGETHRVKTFKLSNDKRFEEKLVDVVGLYLNPPEKAIVLSMDEKSQIQALDRTQASLPMKKGRAGTMTHDYKRHGTTTLFAALDVLTGTVIGECLPRHRHTEFLRFLRTIDREVPKGLQVHLILDNYSTHKHENVKKWLEKHPRFHLHFTPTSSSWLNLIERWFGKLTDKAIRRGIFHSVPELINAIDTYLNVNNENPEPFVWTATAEQILTKVRRGRVALETITT